MVMQVRATAKLPHASCSLLTKLQHKGGRTLQPDDFRISPAQVGCGLYAAVTGANAFENTMTRAARQTHLQDVIYVPSWVTELLRLRCTYSRGLPPNQTFS